MELLSLHYQSASTQLPSTSWRRAVTEKPAISFLAQTLIFPRKTRRKSDFTNPGYFHFRPRASGSTQISGPSPIMEETNRQERSSNDKDLAFVAGATGKVGSRAVRELLRIGFRVRAGVRNVQKAEALVQSVQQIELDDGTKSGNSTPAVEKLEIVQCDLENKNTIEPAIGNASVVICCIGASEKEVFDVTGPYRIDYKASVNLIEAATIVKVDHFILLTSLGTNKIGFPASILNLFWGVLCWKRKAEEALIASGLPYTIVRPGGMERPTDSYKETHNIVLANEDTYFGGQVSNLQVAELMAFMAKHRKVSFCKVVEVIAETTAPLTPLEELLAKIPSQRELPEEPERDPVPLSIELEPTISVAEKVPAQMEAPKPRSLSPYAAYDDLKPPTSPTPTPSSSPKDINGPVFSKSPLGSSTSDVAPGATPINVNEKELFQSSTSQSPYAAYDDLKPPTSPSPSAPTQSIISISAGYSDSTANSTNVSESSNPDQEPYEGHTKQEHTRPLSPFTMYEDLKPPSSPVPSVPKY